MTFVRILNHNTVLKWHFLSVWLEIDFLILYTVLKLHFLAVWLEIDFLILYTVLKLHSIQFGAV